MLRVSYVYGVEAVDLGRCPPGVATKLRSVVSSDAPRKGRSDPARGLLRRCSSSGPPGYHGPVPDDALNPPETAPVPLSRAELDEWYTARLLSLEQIAVLAVERLGVPVSKTKVREWLLALGIPRRSFAQAARARATKRQAAMTYAQAEGLAPNGQLRLSLGEEE